MNKTTVFLIVVLLALGLSTAYAGNVQRIGTAGAQELTIPVGSRGTAMGGATVADVYGIESMYWNPAGLASIEGTEVAFTHLPYIADVDVEYIGAATNIEGFGVIGVGAKIVSIGDMEETTQAQPDGTGRVFSPSLTVLNLTYSRVLTSNVSFGATGMFINEDIFEVSASGFAVDVGFTYDAGWNGLKLGLVVKNYGPTMTFSGSGFERSLNGDRPASPNAASFELPTSINIGIAYDLVDNGPHLAKAAANFRSNSFSRDIAQGGFEYSYDDMYFLRGGYTYSDQDNFVYGASFGAGLYLPLSETTKLKVEYSWNETDTFDDNQYFTIGFAF